MGWYSLCVLLTALASISIVSAQVTGSEPTECASPPIVANAAVSTTGETEGSTAVYVCSSGYEPSGSMEKVCRAGSWSASGPEPKCTQSKCPSPQRVSGGSYRSVTGSYTVGSLVTYTCYSGYKLAENLTNSITCQTDKTWTQPLPVCNRKDCGAVKEIEGGKKPSYTETTYNSRATFECIEGYNLYYNGVAVRTPTRSVGCGSSGSWGKLPECRPKDCGYPSKMSNAQRFTEGKHLFGQSVYYECNHGYEMIGNATITCKATGWTRKPSCVRAKCYDPPTVDNGSLSKLSRVNTYTSTNSYICHKGYDLIGPKTVSCQADGTWSQPPVCSIVNCRTPPQIHFGTHSWDLTTYNSYAAYACDEGYKLIGVSQVMCQSDGTWAQEPKCEIPPGSEKDPETAPQTANDGQQMASLTHSPALTGLAIACALFAVVTLLALMAIVYKMFFADKATKLFSHTSFKSGEDTVDSNI